MKVKAGGVRKAGRAEAAPSAAPPSAAPAVTTTTDSSAPAKHLLPTTAPQELALYTMEPMATESLTELSAKEVQQMTLYALQTNNHKMLKALLHDDERAAPIVASFGSRISKTSLEPVTQALGAASAYCNARAACPASQDALMQLVASRVCQGKCKYNALMDMAFIQDSKELSSQTVPFLIQVSRHNKIHRSIARAALGGLAYRIPSMANVLLQELDSQLRQTAPQDNNELISIINAIGNSGHATVPQRVAEHLHTQDGEVQNSVVDAMRMVPHQHSQSLYETAVTSSGIDHKAKLAAFQRLIQMNHPAVEDYAPMVKAQLVSCRKGMMKYRNGKCFEMIQGAASPEMNMASEESTSGGISQMAADKIKTMNVPSKYLINGPIYSGDHTWEKKFGSNTFGGKIWAAMTYALNGKIGLNGNAEEPVAQDELIQKKKSRCRRFKANPGGTRGKNQERECNGQSGSEDGCTGRAE